MVIGFSAGVAVSGRGTVSLGIVIPAVFGTVPVVGAGTVVGETAAGFGDAVVAAIFGIVKVIGFNVSLIGVFGDWAIL
jgi:hypothetical protein